MFDPSNEFIRIEDSTLHYHGLGTSGDICDSSRMYLCN